MRKLGIIVAIAALLGCAGAGALALLRHGGFESASAATTTPAWREIDWPFPIDQWGKGKAFRCQASGCGLDVTVYIRAKIGFCNCATGVSDDEELDRISDFDLFGDQLIAQAPGQPIAVAWMKGRSRPFVVAPAQRRASVLSIGLNHRCDAIVATAVVTGHRPTDIEPAVLAFLNSPTVVRWAGATLVR